MALFRNPLWGYELNYPDVWAQKSRLGLDGFAPKAESLDQAGDVNDQAAHILVRGEFNGKGENIMPLWNQHITKTSIILGAKNIGSSPFSMGGANGFEAEIQLPQKSNRRLWIGILAQKTLILHLLVSHPRDERDAVEPLATQTIASLKFLDGVKSLETDADGLPVPPQYAAVPPQTLVPDAADEKLWRAYEGSADLGALQHFYYRELPNFGWEISEFIPFPNQVNVGFARLRIHKDDLTATLGILPFGEKNPTGKVVVKYE